MAQYDHILLLICLAADVPTDIERRVAALSARIIVHTESVLGVPKPSTPFVVEIAPRCNPGQKGA